MPVINRVADFTDEIVAWRRDFHTNPELQFDVQRTAGRVAELLRSFGVDEVVTGIGGTGVVGVIRGRGPGRAIGLRADMDALPIRERTAKPYASRTEGRMHACGHDGHTAMLLGAAKYLSETRNFDGDTIVIFQPAEEGGAGARAMIEDGVMDRFGVSEVYGMHNMPGLAAGSFGIRAGGLMAASDQFEILIEGVGGHAAIPHNTIDPVVIAAQLIMALQTVVSRNIDPMRQAVLSVTMVQAGEAFNIIPRQVRLLGTVRTLDEGIRDRMESQLVGISSRLVDALGAKAEVTYRRGYPVTVNSPDQTDFAVRAAEQVAGAERVDANVDATMGAEDFSYMLQARPGAYMFIGNGNSSQLHTDTYDFNDEIIPLGVSFLARLVENASSR